jgi:hypothetical protein
MVHKLRTERPDVMIFNQFEEMGNYLWHYTVTGNAIAEAFESVRGRDGSFAGVCFTSGSAGTLGSGDFLKQKYPRSRIAAGEALQCPTILENGFGAHRVEGIGDKHIPWVHNVRNTDMAIAIDDHDAMALLRLFNEEAGKEFLVKEAGLEREQAESLALMGISGIANMLCCVKFAKYYELTGKDVVATVLTDSVDMYRSRLAELREEKGVYRVIDAAADFARSLLGQGTDHMEELGYRERRRVHNLKYYTWVEQQGKSIEALDDQWYHGEKTFEGVQKQAEAVDALIREFNDMVRNCKNRL